MPKAKTPKAPTPPRKNSRARKQPDLGKPLLTTSQVGAFLCCSRTLVMSLVAQGDLEALRIGTQLRITRESLDRYLAGKARVV